MSATESGRELIDLGERGHERVVHRIGGGVAVASTVQQKS